MLLMVSSKHAVIYNIFENVSTHADVKNPRHQMKVKVNICDRLSVISELVRQMFLQFFGIMHVKDHINSVVIYNIIKKPYFVKCRE